MAQVKDKFSPLIAADTARIRTVVELPFHLSEQVGINTKLIEDLLQISGFRQLRLSGNHHGETSQSVPQIVGMDARGSALAGRSQVKTVPTQQYDIDFLGTPLRKQSNWNDLDLTLNLAEIQQRIRDKNGSVRSPNDWATQIDSALRSGLLKAGVENLFGGFYPFEKWIYAYIYADALSRAGGVSIIHLLSGSLDPHIPTVAEVIRQFIGIAIIFTLLDSMKMGVEQPGKGRRISLCLGPEVDRAIILGIVGNLNQLATTIA